MLVGGAKFRSDTHVALDDAIEQGEMFVRILDEVRQKVAIR